MSANSHGGRRSGAGRPRTKFNETTKVARVPKSLSSRIPEISTILLDLEECIEHWEIECKTTSPRYDRAKQLLQEIKSILKSHEIY